MSHLCSYCKTKFVGYLNGLKRRAKADQAAEIKNLFYKGDLAKVGSNKQKHGYKTLVLSQESLECQILPLHHISLVSHPDTEGSLYF